MSLHGNLTKEQEKSIKLAINNDDLSAKTFSELEDETEDLLNELFGTVKVCRYDYDSGHLLRNSDGIAFHQEVLAYIDNECYEEIYFKEPYEGVMYVKEEDIWDYLENCEEEGD